MTELAALLIICFALLVFMFVYLGALLIIGMGIVLIILIPVLMIVAISLVVYWILRFLRYIYRFITGKDRHASSPKS